MAESDTEQYPSLFNRPRNLIFLPVLVVLHQLAACLEIAYGAWFSSLTVFTHGSYLCFNGMMLSSRFLSVLTTWRDQRYYSLNYVEPSIKFNFAVSLVFGCFAILCSYLALHDLFIAPTIQFNARSFLIPVPGFLVTLAGVYAIMTAYEWPEQSIAEDRSVERTYHHLLSCGFGSLVIVVACIEIYAFGFFVADAIYALFNAGLILLFAINLARESIERSIALKEGDIFFVRSYVMGLNNIFNL